MATVYGSKSDTKALTAVVQAINVAGGSADTSYKIIVPTGWQGYLDINNCFAVVTTAIVNTTTAATVVIKKGTTAVASATCTDSTAAGNVFEFTPVSDYELGVALAADEYITVGWTQGTGGSIAGVLDAYVALELSSLSK